MFLGLLSFLQVLQIYWGWKIIGVIANTIMGKSLEDPRDTDDPVPNGATVKTAPAQLDEGAPSPRKEIRRQEANTAPKNGSQLRPPPQ